MNTKKKLRCFVAMAFGHKDTDAIYNNHIKPAIQKAGLIPVRVDRLIHNDRIDARIRSEIEKASLVITDLTYARPSVYWEAGYAERLVPVIYTSRNDHFKQKESDPFGNYIVHFDLRNANILTWNNTNNKNFTAELTKRINFLTLKSRRELDDEKKLIEERSKFLEMSLFERSSIISSSIISFFKKMGFIESAITKEHRIYQFKRRLYKDNSIILWKKKSSTLMVLSIQPCLEKVSKQDLQKLEKSLDDGWSSMYRFADLHEVPNEFMNSGTIKKVRRIVITPTLDTILDKNIESVFSTWRKAKDSNLFYHPLVWGQLNIAKRNQDRGQTKLLPSSSEIIFIRKIQSATELSNVLEATYPKIETSTETLIYPTPS